MKKFLLAFFIVEISVIFFYVNLSPEREKVLLSGKVIGFEVDGDIKENTEGDTIKTSSKKIGTLTFVKKESNEFSALGHPIAINNKVEDIVGECFEVELNKIEKNSDKLGCICATIDEEKRIGNVLKNNQYGLFGKLDNIGNEEYVPIETSNKFEVKKQNAEIWMNLTGKGIEKYQIEIIGIDYFSNNKNIKFIVKDERLLEMSGGLVQGMSGAPIVQNGKLIGALNQVNGKKYEEGYAIFIEKLL